MLCRDICNVGIFKCTCRAHKALNSLALEKLLTTMLCLLTIHRSMSCHTARYICHSLCINMSESEISLIPAERSHVPAIFELVNRCYLVESDPASPVAFKSGARWSDMADTYTMCSHEQTSTAVAVEADTGELLGFVAWTGSSEPGADFATLGPLAVDSAGRGRGIGRRLVEHAEARAAADGVARMRLLVVDHRTDLLGYYEKLGYEAADTIPARIDTAVKPCKFIQYFKSLQEPACTQP